jgi:hypothetical protein
LGVQQCRDAGPGFKFDIQMLIHLKYSLLVVSMFFAVNPAEKFYRKAGWRQTGLHGPGELRFEMTFETWNSM